jgi:hypothetical protein
MLFATPLHFLLSCPLSSLSVLLDYNIRIGVLRTRRAPTFSRRSKRLALAATKPTKKPKIKEAHRISPASPSRDGQPLQRPPVGRKPFYYGVSIFVKGDAEPLPSFLVIDEDDGVSEGVGAEDNQGGFVGWRDLHSLGTEVLKAGGSQHEQGDGKGNGHDGQGCKPTAKGCQLPLYRHRDQSLPLTDFGGEKFDIISPKRPKQLTYGFRLKA